MTVATLRLLTGHATKAVKKQGDQGDGVAGGEAGRWCVGFIEAIFRHRLGPRAVRRIAGGGCLPEEGIVESNIEKANSTRPGGHGNLFCILCFANFWFVFCDMGGGRRYPPDA